MTNSLSNFFDKFKSIFSKKKENKNLDNSGNSNLRKTLGKISGAFMLPISIMAISGLWLGVGAAIAGNAGDYEGWKKFGLFIQNLGDPIFSLLPLLFAAAFVIAFTDEAGVGVFATIIGFGVFLAIQSVFITPVDTPVTQLFENKEYNVYTLQIATQGSESKTFEVLFKDGSVYPIDSLGKVQNTALMIDKTPVTATVAEGGKLNFFYKGVEVSSALKTNEGFKVLFGGAGRDPQAIKSAIGSTMGFRSLQTSVFGGLAVGLLVQNLYNRFHTISFHPIFSFFAGKRFVAVISVPACALLAFVFLIFWPWVGFGLSVFGNSLGKVPYGFESLIFGVIERSLVPFGLHHAFYSPLWYSDAGGNLNFSLNEWLKGLETQSPGIRDMIKTDKAFENLNALITAVAAEPNKFVGDSTMSVNIIKFSFNNVVYPIWDGKGIVNSAPTPLFDFMSKALGIKAGRFLDGKFSFMILGLPAAAAAMIFAAPKENRKVAISAVVPSAVTTLLTGVTEPIEFTFLFLSPFLFWGFHAFFCGLSFMLANLLSVHIPQVFSGGFLDLIIYGMVPVQKGTNFYWIFVVGLAYIPIYFGFFYWWIKHKDLKTPGRGETVKLFTKADYQKSKDAQKGMAEIDPQVLGIVEAFGGLDNITAFNNCASRLRYDVKDSSIVDEAKLKQYGAVAIKREGQKQVQAIFGPVAEQLNIKIRNSRDAIAKLKMEELKMMSKKAMEIHMETHPEAQEHLPLLETPVTVNSVANGKVMDITQLKDGVFSEKLMGDGYIVKFSDEKIGKVYAPVDGKMNVVFDTKHAYGIETEEGVRILIHIGVDTVNLKGQGFESFVKVGDVVKKGDLLAQVDLKLLKENNLDSSVIVVVLNESKHKTIEFKELNKEVSTQDSILNVR
ncbi:MULTISPECIES: PTS transporter subunit IIABC [unclassified Mycoplasma]|uniref:PTS transporter subunit IIABC n=1 Tax=unclassified Mycoplasma TaxID=2683645 RepID=UPI00211CDB31|nr:MULTISPECIES: PTS transporter subunit IIABC [unclassified Mycoplasma]UUM20069.1 glucose PTS transporter subunit IIA [Mycoplasma sp. 1578d]UUM25049.1 glucose PTS transporter subunit IIA [Mycoplasma sp. 3686d]